MVHKWSATRVEYAELAKELARVETEGFEVFAVTLTSGGDFCVTARRKPRATAKEAKAPAKETKSTPEGTPDAVARARATRAVEGGKRNVLPVRWALATRAVEAGKRKVLPVRFGKPGKGNASGGG